MKRLIRVWQWVPGLLALLAIVLIHPVSAQMALQVTFPDGARVDMTGRNMPRGGDALVLYDAKYGPSTKTNPFGVEVIAVPSKRKTLEGVAYEVTQVTSVWECERLKDNSLCGNASIPPTGIVLSATGVKRDVLKSLKPGDVLTVQEQWFHQKQATVNVVNPSPENNPAGSGFPGYRASNQILIYDSAYGRSNTGTNEFGFEVTVRNGVVVDQEGSDSAIPTDGYVVSGHGSGRSWLIANAPIGAKMHYDSVSRTLSAVVDFDTYLYRFDRRWQESPCAAGSLGNLALAQSCAAIRAQRRQALSLTQGGQATQGVALLADALETLDRQIWVSYDPFPATTIRGAWHRPVEKTAAAIGQTLDYLREAGINTVFLETYFHGYTIFPSQTYAAYGLPTQNPKFEGADLLKLWTEEAHKRDMQVHVWFQTFYGGTKAYLPPGPILAKYPQWANVQFSALIPETPPSETKPENSKAQSGKKASTEPKATVPVKYKSPEKPVPSTLESGGYFLDPANPEVQAFLMKLIAEIATRYDIDGFQLDYIRYPASFPADRFSYRKTTWGYTPVARALFKAKTGVDPTDIDPKEATKAKDPAVALQAERLWQAWNAFKVAQITAFMEKATRLIREKKPSVKISVAIFPEADAALNLKHQDWRHWAKSGWLDFIAPMTLTSASKVIDRDTRYVKSVTNGQVPVFSGIFGPFNDNSAEMVLTQLDTARKAGASGYVLFDTAHLTNRMREALKVMQVPPPVVAPVPPSGVTPSPAPAREKDEPKRRWWQRGKK